MTDAELDDSRAARYSDSEVGEIVAIIGQKTISNFFNRILETELDLPPAPKLRGE